MKKINYINIFNYGYLEFTKNLLLNFKQLNILFEDNLTLVALDELAYKEIKNYIENINLQNIHIKKYIINIAEASSFNTTNFYNITRAKLEIFLSEIKNNEICHFIDSDVFFFKNPKKYILEKILNCDMCFQQDSPRSDGHILYSNYVCTGNFTAKNNQSTINLLKKIIERSKIYNNKNDQELFYEYLNENCSNIKDYKHCNIDIYDPYLFQNGYDTFKFNFFSLYDKVVIHANHMIGKNTKINALKSIGAWLYE